MFLRGYDILNLKSRNDICCGYVRKEKGIHSSILQEVAINKYGYNNYEIEPEIFCDDSPDISFRNRKYWKKLEQNIKEGDTIIFKDVTRFTCNVKMGCRKYIELYNKGINLIFIDNPSIDTSFIVKIISLAKKYHLEEIPLEDMIKLLYIVELEKMEHEKLVVSQRIKDGIKTSKKTQGRKKGKLDKFSEALENDIRLYLNDKTIKQVDLIRKHNISRNTLKKYIEVVKSMEISK